MIIAAAIAVGICGQSCSKEQEKSEGLKPSRKSSVMADPANKDMLLAEMEVFTEDIGDVLEGAELTAVETYSIEDGILVMEATMNAQHAIEIEVREDIVEELVVEHTMTIELDGGDQLADASLASEFISTLAFFEEELEDGEFYSVFDFELTSTSATEASISVKGYKSVHSLIPNDPINSSDNNWYMIDNIGKCDGSVTTGDAARRMQARLGKMNRTYGGNLRTYKFFYINLSNEKIGVVNNVFPGQSFYGSKTGNNYCQYVMGVNDILENYCSFPFFTTDGGIKCISDWRTIEHYTNHMDQVIDNEEPSSKIYAVNQVKGVKNQLMDGRLFQWHELTVHYGVYHVIDETYTNLRDLAVAF